MHKSFEPELLSGRLEFQLNEVFHYPPSKMIAGGMPKVDLLPDDLQVLIAADEVTPVAVHALNLDKLRRAQAEAETKSGRLRLLRELTNSLASNQDLNDVLCAEVDGGVISSACLYELPVYDANPQAYDRKVVPQTNEPAPEGMFPDSIAGLPAMKNGHCGPQISNDGRVNCAGRYGTVSRQLVAVYFERWPENTPKLKEWSHLQDPDVNDEVRGGGKVLRYLGKWYSGVQGVDGSFVQTEHRATSYVWFSANTIVEVLFYDPMPEQEAFLSYYLGKFPSTSK